MADDKNKTQPSSTRDPEDLPEPELEDELDSEPDAGLAEDSEHLFDEAEFEAEGWNIPRDPESIARALRSLEGWLPGILKRSDAGASPDSPDATEEAASGTSSTERLRAKLSDRKLPREAINFILGQVDNTKREFLRIASNEVRLFLESVDLGGELAKILTTLSFEVRMEVRFIPNDQALKPSARGRVRFKKSDAASGKSAAEQGDKDLQESAEKAEDSTGKQRRWPLRRRSSEGDDAESTPDSDAE